MLLLAIAVAGCRAQNDPATDVSALPETIVSSTPPFQTKEPDRYRATRTITIINANGETLVTRSSIAKNGELRRNESGELTYLDVPEGRFVLLPDDKVYAEFTSGDSNNTSVEELEISPERLLHGDTGTTSYQKLGTEVIAGRNSDKYRVVVNDSAPGNVTLSETFIWIDKQLNIPIRSETTAGDGTRITMELSELALDVETGLFQVPKDYEKISFSELRKRLLETRVR